MPLPSSIQIGPYTYTVSTDEHEINRVSVQDGVSFWGKIDHGKLTILVDETTHRTKQRAVLLHEVLHGCWEITVPQGEKFTEEQAVSMLAAPLLDTLRRNPALVAFLMAEESE